MELERGAEIVIHVITLAEIVSKVRREGLDVEADWKAITTLSRPFVAQEEDSGGAGLHHAAIKAERSNFSLDDAFIPRAAGKLGVKILTGDQDFRNLKEAIML
jgi:predicted nucleic acid-binding protein